MYEGDFNVAHRDRLSIVAHVGLHKTATTTLQRLVFPNLSGVHLVELGTTPTGRAVQRLAVQDPLYFDAARARSDIIRGCCDGATNLISTEGLSGSLYASIGKRDLDHRHSIICNLRASVPETRIMLILRRQDEYARAVYRQYVKLGGVLDPQAFFGGNQGWGAHFPRDRFRYLEYCMALVESFPAGVHVGVFEEFRQEPVQFLRRVYDFLGTDAEPLLPARSMNRSRLGSTGLDVCRHLNRMFRSPLNPGGLLPGVSRRRTNGEKRVMSPASILQDRWPGTGRVAANSALGRISQRILHEQSECNQQLQRRLGIDLQRYGYC